MGHFHTSKSIDSNAYEVNRRSVYAMRSIGVGLSGLKKFCGVMNMSPPVTAGTYNIINKHILDAVKNAAKDSMELAVQEEVLQTEIIEGPTKPKGDICISGDGTWMRRGHTSLFGVVTAIGANTSKVIDVEVMSSHCQRCNSWKGQKVGKEYNEWRNIETVMIVQETILGLLEVWR